MGHLFVDSNRPDGSLGAALPRTRSADSSLIGWWSRSGLGGSSTRQFPGHTPHPTLSQSLRPLDGTNDVRHGTCRFAHRRLLLYVLESEQGLSDHRSDRFAAGRNISLPGLSLNTSDR